MRKPRYISYNRFSTSEQGQQDKDSLRRQTEMAMNWAKSRGVEIDESINDLGVSSFRGKNLHRENGLGKFLAAIEQGIIKAGDYLLIEKLDRLSRMPPMAALEIFQKIIGKGITVVTVSDGMQYSTQELNALNGKLFILLGAIQTAHVVSKNKSDRVSASWEKKRRDAAAGIRRRHKAPYWLRYDDATRQYVLIPERADAVRRIYALCLAGKGTKAICAELLKENVPTFGHKDKWRGVYIDKILNTRTVVGEIAFFETVIENGKRKQVPIGEPIRGYYPAVVTEQQWQRVKRIRDEKAFCTTGGRDHVPNLFTGRIYCACCNGQMQLTSSQKRKACGRVDKFRYYTCTERKENKSCKMVRSVDKTEVEMLILNVLSEDLKSEMLSTDKNVLSKISMAEANIDAGEYELKQVDVRISNIEEALFVADTESKPSIAAKLKDANAKRKEIVERLKQLRHDLENAKESTASASDSIAKVKAYKTRDTVEDREKLRSAISAIVQRIDIDTRPDKYEIVITFKTGLQIKTGERDIHPFFIRLKAERRKHTKRPEPAPERKVYQTRAVR